MNETRTTAVQHLEEVEILHQQLAQKERQCQQLQEASRESEERFNLLIEYAPEAIVLIDVDTFRFIDCNEKAVQLFGLERAELLKIGPVEVSPPIQPDGQASSEFAREKAQQGLSGEPVVFEWMHCNAAGEEILCEIRLIRLTASGRHLLCASIFDIRERKKLEESLKERLQFETLLSELSATFVNMPTQKFDSKIEHGMQQIVEFFGADRGTLVEFSEDRKQVLTTHAWAVQGIKPPSLGTLKVEVPWTVGKLRKGEIVMFSRLDELPGEAGRDRQALSKMGQKSLLAVPLMAGGASIGALGIGTLRSERVWPVELIPRFRLLGEIFANALIRKRVEKQLQDAFSEIKDLKDRLEQENIYLREEVELKHAHWEITGNSATIKQVLTQVEDIAETNSTALITGETGTGKELIARAIHRLSSRKDRPMVTVNCAALPLNLIESELFGREKGAYTGALTRQTGRFEVAHGGTIFLDEIGDLPPEVQAKLLRVLQEGQFERLGSTKTITVDVRVIAATNRDLAQAVAEGHFREDLFYRLNVFPISAPPLREHREDIPALVWAFVREFEKKMGKTIERIPKQSLERLQYHPWHGNIRELRNIIEHAMIVCKDNTLRVDLSKLDTPPTFQALTLEEMDRNHILHVLEQTGWRIRGQHGAAEILGLKPTTLSSKMQKLGIKRPE
ncbi:MAG: PAS domain S-box protein [bacterium]|nr:PAS domain S-box protein [bacterium]